MKRKTNNEWTEIFKLLVSKQVVREKYSDRSNVSLERHNIIIRLKIEYTGRMDDYFVGIEMLSIHFEESQIVVYIVGHHLQALYLPYINVGNRQQH